MSSAAVRGQRTTNSPGHLLAEAEVLDLEGAGRGHGVEVQRDWAVGEKVARIDVALDDGSSARLAIVGQRAVGGYHLSR